MFLFTLHLIVHHIDYVHSFIDFLCSSFSEEVSFFTSGTVPSQPDPPMLSEQYVYALTISWIRRPNDDEFLLQMEDEATVIFLFIFLLSLRYDHFPSLHFFSLQNEDHNQKHSLRWFCQNIFLCLCLMETLVTLIQTFMTLSDETEHLWACTECNKVDS